VSQSSLIKLAESLLSEKKELYLREWRGYYAWQNQSRGWELLLGFTKPLFSHLQYSQTEYRKLIALKLEPNLLIARDAPLKNYLANICKTIVLE